MVIVQMCFQNRSFAKNLILSFSCFLFTNSFNKGSVSMKWIRQGCCDFYRRLVRLLFGFVALWLFVSSLVFTSYLPYNEISWICSDYTVLLCLLFAVLCLALLQY